MQVGTKDKLNCYYAHAQQREFLQVRRTVMSGDNAHIIVDPARLS